jgi:citrate synthase
MNGPASLREHIGVIRSRVGAAVLGSHAIFRGKNLHTELGDLSWMAIYLLGITGRRFSDAQLRVLEALWCYTSYPDSRIWNNRVAALAGSTRSTGNLALAAALAVSEAGIYGQGPCIRAIEFLYRTRAALDAGATLEPLVREELHRSRSLGGYGRPVTAADERSEPLLRLARSLGLGDGPYLKLAGAIERCLLENRYRLHMNYAGVAAGLAADIGLSPREYYFYLFPVFLAGMPPCYIDASERPEGAFLPLPCDGVAHRGRAKRPWPAR